LEKDRRQLVCRQLWPAKKSVYQYNLGEFSPTRRREPIVQEIQIIADGILPNRGSLMLDVVFIAMMAVLPVLALSVVAVRYQNKYSLHRWIQIATAVVLLFAIVAFEIDLRFFADWRSAASQSAYYDSGWVDRLLWFHLLFAIPTPFVWAWVIWGARKFGRNPRPGSHSKSHRFWGKTAAAFLLMTSITGWMFYVAAFVF